MKVVGLVALVVIAITPVLSLAQVKASGSEVKDVKQFISPMTLDLPMKAFFDSPAQKDWQTNELSMFSCKGIVIESLTLTLKQSKTGKPMVIKGALEVSNNSDKDADVNYYVQILLKEEVIDQDTPSAGIDEGERDTAHFSLKIPSQKESSKADMVLRISVRVKSN